MSMCFKLSIVSLTDFKQFTIGMMRNGRKHFVHTELSINYYTP